MARRSKRPRPPEEVAFPVTPFLDMAFQLLAFFILTFRAPSREARIDLYLPTAAATLPTVPRGRVLAPKPDDPDLENDLQVRATADARGNLASLRLGETVVRDPRDLEARVREYARLLNGKPLRVSFVAPDALRYEEAARIVGACQAAGVTAVRLVEPEGPRR
jgi:biopolymer transport protein ExbD